MRHRFLLLLVLLTALTTSSCGLLPTEEAVRTAPVIKTYTRKAYQTTPVMRGDLIQTTKVSCVYIPVQTASLSFAISGEYIDQIMVQPGAAVEKGQLLAQLHPGDLYERMEETNNAIAQAQLRHTYVQKQYELALRRHEITSKSLSPEEKARALSRLQEEYAQRGQALLDEAELLQLTLSTLEEKLALRQIRAPFSGMVSRVANIEEGEKSTLNANIVTLIDSTMSLFKANTEHWASFIPGESYNIIVKDQAYPATVATEADLGLEAPARTPGEKANVYFVLDDPTYNVENGKVGTISLVLSEHKDVLYLPAKALSSSQGQPIVYYRREDGMKAIKQVETGVTVGEWTEIVSGLQEGDLIIADEERTY